MCWNEAKIHEKSASELNQKRCLKTELKKKPKITKNDSKMAPKKWPDFGGNAYWGAFGGPNRFCDEKVGPQRCQSAPKARKISQKCHKRNPRMRKWASKVNPFRSQSKMSSKSGSFSEQDLDFCNYSISQLLHYLILQLLNYSITQLLNYSITRLLNYSITQSLNYSMTQVLNY